MLHSGHPGARGVWSTFFAELAVFIKDALPDLVVVPCRLPNPKMSLQLIFDIWKSIEHCINARELTFTANVFTS